MIEGRTIVCIGSAWDYDPTSKHHVMRILSRRNRILWVNYHGSRRPTVSRADVLNIGRKLRRVTAGVTHVNENLLHFTPLVIPGARGGMGLRLHEAIVLAQIKRVLRRHADRACPVQVWSFAPDVPFLVGRLDEERFVYYCVDDFASFEGFDREFITRREGQMLRRADAVIATSEALQASRRRIRPDTVLVRHGVDYDHFARALHDDLERPVDLPRTERPIFGYFGLIAHWVDVELVAQVARLRPEYEFVLIGECATDVSCLSDSKNIHLLGRRPFESLPNYCASFAAGLMLFKQTDMTRHVNPIKMCEYLAAGLPVVSTPLPEAEQFHTAIRIADEAEAFARCCDSVVRETSMQRRARISGLVADHAWEARVKQLCQIVMGPQTSDIIARPRGVIATPQPGSSTSLPDRLVRAR